METINEKLETLLRYLGVEDGYMTFVQRVALIFIIVVLAYVSEKICRKCLLPVIRKVTAKTQSIWDDYLLGDEVLGNVCHLVFPVVVSALAPHAFYGAGGLSDFIGDICWIYITIVTVKLICGIFSALYRISSEHEKFRNHSLKAFYQMLKLVTICIGVIVVISTLINKNPLAILTGLGAGTAILMLVFQDTIKGLVAGIQLTVNDMLRPGDWIAMPKYGADGSVIEVTLTTVKVRNWDNTITTIPPYTLVSTPFKNWRGMQESGGRRVDKMIYLDMTTIEVCTPDMIDDIRKNIPLMKDYQVPDIPTNSQLYRVYIEKYLRSHPIVAQNLDLIIAQRQPGQFGLPIEVYFFLTDKVWNEYETIQSDIFDHLIAMASEFGLKMYQLEG